MQGSVTELMEKERRRIDAPKRRKAGESEDHGKEEPEHKPFFPHQTSHWLGLDVHDVGDYVVTGQPRALEAGMVLTIEPGLYIPSAATLGPAELAGTGVRIEDDVLVTKDGREVLTAALPADADTITALVR